jgi:hypothetical protein
MMTALALERGQLEDGGSTLASLREASLRWASRERARPRCPSGVPALDAALGGGWPQGRVCELVGPRSCGRTGTAVATLAAAAGRGEVAAWVDGADAFDPVSAAAAGVSLDRVLWVRPRSLGEAVRAAEVVLDAGGFTVLVVDLGNGRRAAAGDDAGGEPGARRAAPLRLRLARAVERAGVAALVLAERPWAGSSAAVTVLLAAAHPVWAPGTHDNQERRDQWSVVRGQCAPDLGGIGCGSRVWLAGLEISFHLQRGGARTPSLSERAEGF